MRTVYFLSAVLGFAAFLPTVLTAAADDRHEEDVFATAKGDLTITFLGHSSLLMRFDGKVVAVDPFGEVADYSSLPKADLVLITHEHYDHFDAKALAAILKPGTVIVASRSCSGKVWNAHILENGQSGTFAGLSVAAVPAYNIEHKRPDGTPFHPKGNGNGYLLDLGGKRVYIAGDTENIPEMAELKGIDIAFLPVNLPYTMSLEQAAAAARTIRPAVLYPYHFSNTDIRKLAEMLKSEKAIEVRLRKMS